MTYEMTRDHEHLLACWDRTYLTGATHRVAEWCGWTFDEALSKMLELRDARLVDGTDRNAAFGGMAVYPCGPHKGHPLHIWGRPTGARGLPLIEDPRLLACGIARALVTNERKVMYQGNRPLDVHRVAKREGWSLAGYSLEWLGPDPTGKPQLEIPVGVVLDS